MNNKPEKSNNSTRAPASFTYEQYRRYYYGNIKEKMSPQENESIGTKLARETARAIRAHVKPK
jgi:hypothetical protein